jgi:hypothetical protein
MAEKQDVSASCDWLETFLKAMTDEQFLHDPRFSDPFQ